MLSKLNYEFYTGSNNLEKLQELNLDKGQESGKDTRAKTMGSILYTT